MITETLITLFLFAINPVINKYMLQYISVMNLVLFSGVAYIAISAILIAILYNREMKHDFGVLFENHRKYLWLIVVMLPVIHIITHYFYFSLIRDNKTYYVTALIASYPLLTAIFGYLILNEGFGVLDMLGIVLIVAGVSVLNIKK